MSETLPLRVLVFVSGLTVMAVEMTGLRLLAPFFGTSLVVTTILIGSMMGFLSLGYWLGGKRGDAHPTLGALAKVTGFASAWVIALPFIGQPILRAAAATMQPLIQGDTLDQPALAVGVIAGGLLGVLALFALPVTLMGMVSPWAVRLAVTDVTKAGQDAGRLYALSTVGSILGSFLPALALIPALGVRRTFITVGALLLAASALAYFKKAAPPVGGVVVGILLMFVPQGTIRPMDGLMYEAESLYHFIQVVEEPYGRCDRAAHLYLNEGVGVHSVKCLDDNADTRGTWAYMGAAPLYREDPQGTDEVLIIGLAGGTIARHLLASFPDAHIDGVEIDGAVVEVGQEYFDNDDPRITPYVLDGRVFLQATDRSYDVILVDAYRQPYIPFHLTTVEFWEQVAEHLDDDGVVAINVASVRGVSMSLTTMIYATMREVFPSVHHVDATQSNDILYATKQESRPGRMQENIAVMPKGTSRRGIDQIRTVLHTKTHADIPGWRDARVLTDDQAPVELAWDLMALQFAG
jgi:predicted membrane-bound spermidine synthase